jgi:hypothetical protein
MKVRSVKDIEKSLLKKGFEKTSSKEKSHHTFYYFIYNGKRSDVYTYLSHGSKSTEYGPSLMNKIRHQLKFEDAKTAERFLDCPLTQEQYIEILKKIGELD